MNEVAGRRSPGALLLHPLAMLAIAVLVVNDHVLKGLWGNALTGKLSDIAGVFVFPLLLSSIARATIGRCRPDTTDRPAATAGAVLLRAVGFAAVKLVGPIGDAYALTIGALRWMLLARSGEIAPIEVIRDPTDVLVLPVLIPAYAIARRVIDRETAASGAAMSRSRRAGSRSSETASANSVRSI